MSSSSGSDSFTEFGGSFQDKLVYSILLDKQFAEQILEVIEITFFDKKYLRDLVQTIQEHYQKYKKIPSIESLETSATEIKDKISKEQAKIFIDSIKESNMKNSPLEDLDFIKDKSLDFCKKQNLKKALFQAADMLKYSKFDEIVAIIKKSITLGTNKDIGILYSSDFEQRYDEKSNRVIPTPWHQADKLMNGGFSTRELHVFMAPVTRGKSHLLVQSGAEAAKRGFNVIHYTLELSDKKTALRYDSCISKISYDDLLEFKDIIKDKVQNLIKGSIIIKEFSTKTASSQTIRNHISKVKMRGIDPDLIIVDYADLMKPVSSTENKRFELESIYEDLRGIAGDFDVPVITATQSQRGAAEEDYISLESVAESYLKAAVCDTLISFSRKIEDMALGTGKLFFAKNRSGISGLVLNVSIDTSTSTITVLDEEASLPDVKKQQQNRKLSVDRR
jgi:replicative DNA helicase